LVLASSTHACAAVNEKGVKNERALGRGVMGLGEKIVKQGQATQASHRGRRAEGRAEKKVRIKMVSDWPGG
jgi:hypothetical protein